MDCIGRDLYRNGFSGFDIHRTCLRGQEIALERKAAIDFDQTSGLRLRTDVTRPSNRLTANDAGCSA